MYLVLKDQSRNSPSPPNPVTNVLAALQSQLPLAPLLMPNHLGLGNLGGMSPQDMNALFQQVQQASLQQQLQNYMELLQSSANSLGQQKNANAATAQVQAAAQFFQVCTTIDSDSSKSFYFQRMKTKIFLFFSIVRSLKLHSNCKPYKSSNKLKTKQIHRYKVHLAVRESQHQHRF